MRAFDLTEVPFHGLDPEGERLVVPALVLPGRHLRIVDYWFRQVHPSPLPRIEVDWNRGLRPASVQLLQRLKLLHGRDGLVVVIRLIRPDIDVEEVLRTLDDFRFLAIHTELPARNLRLRGLGVLCWRLRRYLARTFPQRVVDLELPNHWEKLAPLLADLVDPEEIMAATNGFLEVQLAGLREEGWMTAVKRQVIVRQMSARKPAEFVQILAYACKRPEADRLRLTGGQTPEDQVRLQGKLARELAEQALLLDDGLLGWAAWLQEDGVAAGLFRKRGGLPMDHQRLEDWGSALEEAVGWMEGRVLDMQENWDGPELEAVWLLMDQGQLERAREELESLEWRLEAEETTELWRMDYFHLVGGLHLRTKNYELANTAFSCALQHGVGAPVRWRVATLSDRATALAAQGRDDEAEKCFEEALALGEAGPDVVGVKYEYALFLASRDKYADSNTIFEQLQSTFSSEGGAHGTWAQVAYNYANSLFRQKMYDTALEQYFTATDAAAQVGRPFADPTEPWRQIGKCYHALQQWKEAEEWLKKALASIETLSPAILVENLNLLADCYEKLGQDVEAEASYRRAMATLVPEMAPQVMANCLFCFGKLLFKQKRFEEAEKILALLQDTTQQEGLESGQVRSILASHGFVLHQLRRYPEAAARFQQVLDLLPPLALKKRTLLRLADTREAMSQHKAAKELRREAAAIPGPEAEESLPLIPLNLSAPTLDRIRI